MLAQIIQNNTYRIDHVVWRHCSAIAEVYDDLDFHYTGMHRTIQCIQCIQAGKGFNRLRLLARCSRDETTHSEITASGMETGQANGGGRVTVRDGETEILTLSRGTDTIRHRCTRSSFFRCCPNLNFLFPIPFKKIHAVNQTCGTHYNTWMLEFKKRATSQYQFYHTNLSGYG